MDQLKQQILYMRQQMYSQGMLKELSGFDTAVRLFAAPEPGAKKKTFKEKAADVWKKHKGKILAGAAIAATAGAGAYGAHKLSSKDGNIKDAVPNNPKIIDMHKPTVEEFYQKLKKGEDIPSHWATMFYDVYQKALKKYFDGESHS